MSFVRGAWKLLVGIKDAMVLLAMLLFFGVLYATLSMSPNAGGVKEGALLLDLSGSIVEQPAETDPVTLIAGGSGIREYRLSDVIRALDKAAGDGRVKAVALDLDIFLGGGQVALGDVADAIDRVKKAGKPVLAYATGYSDDSYRLAAHASEVWLNPMGTVLVAGPGGQNLYYKDMLDKIGVTANIYRVGTYKSAVEPYSRTDMSPEAREASQALVSALWEQWLDDVRKARPKAAGIADYAARPAEALAATQGDMAQAALRAGLVDKLGDRTDFGKRMAELVGVEDDTVPGSFNATLYDDWIAAHPAPTTGKIGIATVAGFIIDGEGGGGTAGGATISTIIRTALKEKDLSALVVRIDTPGGSTLASEEIRRALLDAKAAGLPVVVSMGNTAASGGYWIATAADRIYAEPSTITGSIGVFGIVPSFEGLTQKIGVNADGVKTTPLSGEPDVFRGPSDTANQVLQLGVENSYRRFITLVANARKLPVGRVDQIAQGRPWDGGTARQLGLVDAFGSLDEAVAEAARRAKLDPAKVETVHLDREKTFFEMLMSGVTASEAPPAAARDAFTRAALKPEWLLRHAIADAETMLSSSAIQARCLECPIEAAPQRAKKDGLLALLASWLS
ncbi:signal peptide peptidase SppA [Allosphingosinicella vermicomposti]|uniref:signal peptide peptidase SppA n=1 Tax=Allosphingosinicella vermicomposti TaxID=614671 RepID=UPI000D1123A1|nr:signal peptide peptidase SppA [Allosphingosinicella vermicomposti]